MYVRFPPLPEETIQQLRDLRQAVPMKKAESHRRRMGENGINALSEYQYSRWFDWPQSHRSQFKTLLPKHHTENALVGWFLEMNPKTGFLDRITTWVDEVMAGTILTYALGNDQKILIDDRPVIVGRGEGIGFSLRNVHEIKPSEDGQLWACVMVLGDPRKFV